MGTTQLHKRLTTVQVTVIVQKYVSKRIKAKEAVRYLGLGRTRFYELVKLYREHPETFQLQYVRHVPTPRLNREVAVNILKELKTEKKLIANPEIPTRRYNYTYVKELLEQQYNQKVSVPTIIAIAKEHGYYKPRMKQKNTHDREVVTHCVGELIQHDSSHHLFAPDARRKWYLITSLDDYSRRILYGELVEVETSWAHIMAVEYVCLRYGIPYAYYSDQHSIFRYVKGRDTNRIWNEYKKLTDDVDTQWKQILRDLSVDPKYALSPQAKGKIERPYQWLQDHLVRTCVRGGITDIERARELLREELSVYNNKRVHSTTGEIPMIRFNRAVTEGKTLFRSFAIPTPYESVKDIFAWRVTRMTDGYRTVSVKGTKLKVPNGDCYVHVELRMYPDFTTKTIAVRFWQNKKFLGTTTIPLNELSIVHY